MRGPLLSSAYLVTLYQAYLDKQIGRDNTGTLEPKSLILFKRPMINAIEYPDSAETHIELDSKNEPIDRKKEQDQDSDIGEVKKWIKANEIPDLTYANSRLKKYAKQFNRLVIEDEVLLRNFYDDTGKI